MKKHCSRNAISLPHLTDVMPFVYVYQILFILVIMVLVMIIIMISIIMTYTANNIHTDSMQ